MSDRKDVLPEADPAVAADEAAMAEDSGKTSYIEFVGQEPHGTEFYGSAGTHTITRKDIKDAWDLDLGTKEVVWRKGSNGRFLVPESSLPTEVADRLAADPMFKRVDI